MPGSKQGPDYGPNPHDDDGKRCKALSGSICQRSGCDSLLPTGPRRGSPRRFCSSRCRWLSWREANEPRSKLTHSDNYARAREETSQPADLAPQAVRQ